jgi:membrane protein implicated in regulation of membrane protease activity
VIALIIAFVFLGLMLYFLLAKKRVLWLVILCGAIGLIVPLVILIVVAVVYWRYLRDREKEFKQVIASVNDKFNAEARELRNKKQGEIEIRVGEYGGWLEIVHKG